MLLNIKEKYFYFLFIIAIGILVISCAENFKSEVSVLNRSSYDIIDLKVGDTDFHTVKANTMPDSEFFTPGSYKIEGIIDLDNNAFKNIKFDKTFQINASRMYTIKIRNDNTDDAYIVITED